MKACFVVGKILDLAMKDYKADCISTIQIQELEIRILAKRI